MREGIELMEDLENGSKDLTFVEGYSKRARELLHSNVYIFYMPGKDVLNSVEACKEKVQSVINNSSGSAARGKLEALAKLLDQVIRIYDKSRER